MYSYVLNLVVKPENWGTYEEAYRDARRRSISAGENDTKASEESAC